MQKLYAVPGDAPVKIVNLTPEDAITPVLCLDESVVPGCIFTQGAWIRKDFTCPGLIRNQSDILFMSLRFMKLSPKTIMLKLKQLSLPAPMQTMSLKNMSSAARLWPGSFFSHIFVCQVVYAPAFGDTSV